MSPSALHEVLIELLRQVPEHLAPALARALPGLDPTLPVTFVDAGANEPLVVERRADAVMLFGNPAQPELVVVTEIQLSEDTDKIYAWPQYMVAMHNRWRCEVELLIIAPHPRVARWASQPIRLNRRGSQVIPLVLGTEDFPRLDVKNLAGHPHATMFHALLHCREQRDLPLLQQALSDVNTLPQADRIGYYGILRRCLTPSFLELAEVAMSLEHTRFYQEFVEQLKSQLRAEVKAEVRAEVKAEVIAEMKAQDMAAEMAQGRAEGEQLGRRALLRAISLQLGRNLALPGPEALAKMESLPLETLGQLSEDLLSFTSPQELDHWLARH